MHLYPHRDTNSYCVKVRLEDKEDKTNLEAARTW